MTGRRKAWFAVVVMAVFLLAYRVVPVCLEQEQVSALAGSVANKVIVVDGSYGGYGDGSSTTALKLAHWLGQSGAMVLVSGDADPALDYPATAATGMGALESLAERAGPADLVVSVRSGAPWSVTYSAGGGVSQLATDIAKEIPLTEPVLRPEITAVSGASVPVPWVEVRTGSQDGRGENNCAWAVYAGIVRYFAQQTPAVNGKVLNTLENDIPSTVDSQ